MSGKADIADRMADCLDRQVALLEVMREELSDSDALAESSDMAANQQQRAAVLDALDREYQALVKEWSDSGRPRAEDEALRSRVARVDSLVAEVRPLLAAAESALHARMAELRGSLAELDRGRKTAAKFAGGGPSVGGGLDRQG